jgi:hypothetical protein
MGHRVWDQVVTLNVGFMERLRFFDPAKLVIGLRYEAFQQDFHADCSINLRNVQHVMTMSKLMQRV